MPRLAAVMLLSALSFPVFGARTLDGDYPDNPPRSQQDIIRDREKACKGLKGQAYSECVANYVGPKRDNPDSGWRRPAKPAKDHGRS